MARYIEYYEMKTNSGYEYYYMPVDPEAKNKENLDHQSLRIWKYDTKTKRITDVKNWDKLPAIDPAEFFAIQLTAKPVPYSDYYLRLKEIQRWIDECEDEKSADLD